MSIVFKNTAYLDAIKQETNFEINKQIFDDIKTGDLKYEYKNIDRQKFNQHYSSDGWRGRKVIALPTAGVSLLKIIYHAFKLVTATFSTHHDKAQLRTIQSYNIARDGQEIYGRIMSIFSDRYGQYYIQRSEFQKTCYECHIKPDAQHGINLPWYRRVFLMRKI